MVEAQNDQDRLMDDTLARFQDAIADTGVILPAGQHRQAAEPKDVPPSSTPLREDAAPSLIGHALSLVKKVVISEHKAVMVKKVVISEQDPVQTPSPSSPPLPAVKPAREKLSDARRADPLIDRALSIVAAVSIDEPDTRAAGRQPGDKTVWENVLPLRRSSPEQPFSRIDQSHVIVVEAAPAGPKTEDTLPLPWQRPMKQLSPKERLEMDRADIRQRVAIFREHQQRFQRERDEYYATMIAKVRTIAGIAET